jgi:tripartite-type tricarboxylate transporter receptor subunit TctC
MLEKLFVSCHGGVRRRRSAQLTRTKPIVLVVPFSAGGRPISIARIMAERLTRALGQTVVVENTAGAGGSIAVGRSRAPRRTAIRSASAISAPT